MKKYLPAFILFVLVIGCKVAYQPPVTLAPTNYLVVEGTINSNNSSTDSTFFKLSRTVNLQATTNATKPELHAIITIEDGQGYVHALKETGNGNYVSGPLGLDNTKKYQARIKTNDNKVYLSDLEPIIYTPPIDSVGYTTAANGIQIYVNTHNPADNTRYYRWEFEEVWKILTPYTSLYVSNGSRISARTPQQDVHTCWASDVSTGIIVSSSIKLAHDVIYQAPLTPVAANSEKLGARYSILVKQYGITADAFTFWDQLRKNTETLGSIFDAQPSEISGNIHCVTNQAERVFGFVGVTNVKTKRVYINKGELPADYRSAINNSCFFFGEDTVINRLKPPYLNTVKDLVPTSSPYTIVDAKIFLLPPSYRDTAAGYYAVKSACGDCSNRGSTIKPSFWVDQ